MLRKAAARALTENCLIERNPCNGSEDFSYYLLERPGAFFFAGTGYTHQNWHEPNFDFNDELLHDVIRVYICLIEDRFGVSFSN
jgi:metal-dependent amidase/aminoacylase/carboxypeptidase family protein